MNLIFTIFIAVSSIIIGFIVLKKKPKSATHISFAVFCASLALWPIVNYLAITVENSTMILFWMRAVMLFAVIQSISFFLFIHTFPDGKIQLKKSIFLILLLAGVITAVISLSPLLFSDATFNDQGNRLPVVQPGIWLFLIVTIGSLLSAFYILINKTKRAVGIVKMQLRFILVGALLMFCLVLLFNLVLVIFFRISIFVGAAPMFVLPFTTAVYYAITRYRLMDIRLVIKKSLAYTLGFGSMLGMYAIIILVIQRTLIEKNDWDFTTAMIVTALIIAVSAEPLRRFVVNAVNKLFYPQRRLQKEKEFGSAITFSSANELESAAESVLKAYIDFLDPSFASFLVREPKSRMYLCHFPKGVDQKISFDDTLAQYVRLHQNILVTEEIPFLIEDHPDRKLLHDAGSQMKSLKAAVAIPLGDGKTIYAIFLLGVKKSKEIYTKEDIDVLQRFQLDATPIIINTLLYKEAIERISK